MTSKIQKDVVTVAQASNDDTQDSKESTKRIKLDRIDMQILHDLQMDGRMTNVKLAENAGISAPPCLRRVRALEDAGYIEGYHADLNASSLGYTIKVFAHVNLKDQSEMALKDFEEFVAQWAEVRECHMLAGETDFLLKISAKDWDDYQNFVTRKLTSAPHVANVRSSLAIRTNKSEPGVPIQIEQQDVPQPRRRRQKKAA